MFCEVLLGSGLCGKVVKMRRGDTEWRALALRYRRGEEERGIDLFVATKGASVVVWPSEALRNGCGGCDGNFELELEIGEPQVRQLRWNQLTLIFCPQHICNAWLLQFSC